MSRAKIYLGTVLIMLVSDVDCYMQEKNKTQVIMFVFGDSLFDPGNSNFLNRSEEEKANHRPYGETFFPVPTGRFSDGRIIPDFLAMEVGLPLWKPYLGPNGTEILSLKNGANFASAGAHAISTDQDDYVIDLPEQVVFMKNVAKELRQELGEAEANKTLMEAIYLLSIGGVDYDDFYSKYGNATQSQRHELVMLVVGNLTSAIKEIYEIGGRKYVFQNVGPMGCVPLMKLQEYGTYDTDECVEELLDISKQHNVVLLEAAKELESTLEGFQYSIFDYYSTLHDIIRNHTLYDFKVEDVPCCGPEIGSYCGIAHSGLCSNVSEYVFFDSIHPTERVYMILSQLMWNGGATVTVPRNFKQLFELNVTSGYNTSHYAAKNVRVAINDNVAAM